MTVQLHLPLPAEGRPDGGRPVPHLLATLVVTAKIVIVVSVLRVLLDPAWANLEGKAPVARAIMYPLWALAVPVFWATTRRATAFPWLADLLVTLTCFNDLVGNRLDLYNSVDRFDDWMHLVNAALVSAAFVVLTVERPATLRQIVEAAVALGVTASLGWELFEYGTFLTRSTEWTTAYSDTIGDLMLGWLGSVMAGLVVALVWRRSPHPGHVSSDRGPLRVGRRGSGGLHPR